MDKNVIRILIADDHPIFRDGLRRLLEAERGLQVVGEAADGEETVKLAQQLKPDIVLLDLAMPRVTGLEALRELAVSPHRVRTVVLTAAVEREQIVEAFRLGARGVVLKESATQLLFKCLRAVMADQYWLGHDAVSDLVRLLRELTHAPGEEPGRSKFGLTPREMEIVGAIVTGYTNKDIAQKLRISEQTVKHHLSSIFDKLGVSNRLELGLFAVSHRLLGS